MSLPTLKIIGVEEHVTFPKLFAGVASNSHSSHIFAHRSEHPTVDYAKQRSTNTGAQRIADMDESGVTMQLLSLAGAVNSTHLTGGEAHRGVKLAREINDQLKIAVDGNPRRFRAFAELPFHEPQEAVKELHRCVKELGFIGAMLSGSVSGEGKYLDAPEFDPVLSAFEELDVPLFLHPGVPPKAVFDTYYKLDNNPLLSAAFGLAGWGWHCEVAIHVLRLALSGTLDKHPKLRLVIGHQGEMMPMMMKRFDKVYGADVFGFKRTVSDMLRSQVWVAVSGFFSVAPTMALIETWGIDRVLFANDYPFMSHDGVTVYLSALGEMVAPADLRKICQTNAENLFGIQAE